MIRQVGETRLAKDLTCLASRTVASAACCATGRCIAGAFIRTSPTGDPASGNVCNGWNTPVEDLIGLNLLVEVKRRLWTLPEEHRTVYVVGHSRGGALVRCLGFVTLLFICHVIFGALWVLQVYVDAYLTQRCCNACAVAGHSRISFHDDHCRSVWPESCKS